MSAEWLDKTFTFVVRNLFDIILWLITLVLGTAIVGSIVILIFLIRFR